jgi:hypothetical protein
MMSLPLFFILGLSGCVSGPSHSSALKQPQQMDRSQQTATEMQQIAAELHVSEFPATARSIQQFRKITPQMTMKDVIKLCGLPDIDTGSGLYVFEYKLADGSAVFIGTGDLEHLTYVKHGDEQLIGNSAN